MVRVARMKPCMNTDAGDGRRPGQRGWRRRRRGVRPIAALKLAAAVALPGAGLSLDALADGPRWLREALIRRRAQVVHLGGDDVLCRVLGRYKLLLAAGDLGFASHVMLDGYWEMWATELMLRQVRSGMRVIDIGANYGYYTLLLADLVGAAGACFAIEPNPVAAAKLRASVALNGFDGWTSVLQTALGLEAEGHALFHVPPREPKNARIVGRPSEAGDDPVVGVAVTSLDALADRLGRVDFIKIDAEGSETGILAGAEGLIAAHRPELLVEFNTGRGEPAALLERLGWFYPAPCSLELDGSLRPVTPERLLRERRGEDWLLSFGTKR